MNKVVDERLIPNGQYIDALNVRMGSTELSEIGAIEKLKKRFEAIQKGVIWWKKLKGPE